MTLVEGRRGPSLSGCSPRTGSDWGIPCCGACRGMPAVGMPTYDVKGFASSRSCGRCGYALNLSSSNLNTAGIGAEYRRAIRKGVVSFLAIDETRFTQADELRCLPYFRSRRSWGLLRRRTRLLCGGCGCLIGVAYRGDAVSSDDNSPPPPASGSTISGSARCSPPTTTSQLRPFSRDQSIWFSD
ncbi:hypothetical protein BHM03_00052792 [Ensete ventricosum]|nr:hypothetical protein BHM03_00052792 [Ensete ventricosum]